MLINFAWPRAASNPKPNQTSGLLHLNFLDGIPILWTVVIFIALIGAVYYLLVGQIVTGALAPGDRLPGEHELAEWFGVSRMTLRHALAELARRGLVTKTV